MADRQASQRTERTERAGGPGAGIGARVNVMTPSQVIEIRESQPIVLRWVLTSAQWMAAVLLAASVTAFAGSLWAAMKRPAVWAVLPRGDVVSITPLTLTPALEQGVQAALRGSQGSQGGAR